MTTTSDLSLAFFNATTEPILVVDVAAETIVDANARTLGETGYTRDELAGLGLHGLFPSPDALARCLRGNSGRRVEGLRLLTKAGTVVGVTAHVTLVTLGDRRFGFIVLTTHAGQSTAGPDDDECDPAPREFSAIVGKSEPIRNVCRLIGSVARSDATVLIQGESGTGKEIVANAIHLHGRRRRGPFVKVNCAALTESLLESELFGHVKGAFTGAIRDRRGRFKQADGGTILLDEIGSMPVSGQAALLRVLQEREYSQSAARRPCRSIVRVIAATNTDLAKAVTAGTFRADLYYRLNVFGIPVPSLRERAEDIPLLAQHFLGRYSQSLEKGIRAISTNALAALLAHDWPGNVRELENAIEHAVIVEAGSVIHPSSLPANITVDSADIQAQDTSPELGLRERLTLVERQILLETLQRANGIKKRAARDARHRLAKHAGIFSASIACRTPSARNVLPTTRRWSVRAPGLFPPLLSAVPRP